MFTIFYELIGSHLPNPVYRNEVFTHVGWLTIVGAFFVAIIFYIYLGRRRPIFHRPKHWGITLSVVMMAAFGLAIWYAIHVTRFPKIDDYMVWFGIANSLFGGFFFFLFSYFMRRASYHARNTPF